MSSVRVKKIFITPIVLFQLFESREMLLRVGGIPEGAQFRGFAHDYFRNCIAVFVEHESFDPVPEGCEFPELIITISTLKIESFEVVTDAISQEEQ